MEYTKLDWIGLDYEILALKPSTGATKAIQRWKNEGTLAEGIGLTNLVRPTAEHQGPVENIRLPLGIRTQLLVSKPPNHHKVSASRGVDMLVCVLVCPSMYMYACMNIRAYLYLCIYVCRYV